MEYVITEGVESLWNYHISKKDNFVKSLCGKQTMGTSMPLGHWGFTLEHIPQTYCEKCKEIYDNLIKNKR